MESIISLGSPASAKAGRNRTVGQTANYGPPCSGIEWNGISWNIMEYRGIAWNGMESIISLGSPASAKAGRNRTVGQTANYGPPCSGIEWNGEYRGISWNSMQ